MPPVPPRMEVPPTLMFVPEIRSRIEEGKELSQEDYRRIVITLRVTLTKDTLNAFDTYRVPSTHKLLISGVRAHVALTSVAGDVLNIPAEPALASNFTNRIAFKAANCRVSVTNQDDTTNIIGENKPMSLADIMPLIGGLSINWEEFPHIMSPGTTVQGNFSLLDSADYVVGAPTEYGVTLDGMLVRVRQS